jgi:nucleotide-binding universal stress UspA family protein
MSDTVIAGLDLDAPAQTRDALALATWLADATASELLLATIFAPRGGALDVQIERRRGELARLAGRPAEILAVASTAPARLLHELADQRRPRALVIGSSRGGAPGLVSAGSTGEMLLHGSSAPVAVAPNGFVPRRRTPEIGVAYGVTPESDDAVRAATALAARAGARAGVLELEGDPMRALAAASRELDLLIAGSRSYGPLGAVLLGAVTRRLVTSAACPLMLVPRTRDAALAVALIGGMEADVAN